VSACVLQQQQQQGTTAGAEQIIQLWAAVTPKATDGTLKEPVQLIIYNKMHVINVKYDVRVYIVSQL
jgi:hypothetical protein